MNKEQFTAIELYTEYVRLRQGGWSQGETVQQLQAQAALLSKTERSQLGQIIMTWEGREGINFTQSKKSSLPPTTPAASTADKPVIRRIASPAKSYQPPAFAENVARDGVPCPNCSKLNGKQEIYCYACGHVLDMHRSGTRALDDEIDSGIRWGTAHFGQFSSLVFTIRGTEKTIEVVPTGELVIGRADSDSAVRPDIDLTPYNAEELGVSRLHASIKRLENTVSLSDMNSRNNTYINGQKLHPNEVRVVRDGDEIRLGRLTLRVAFKQQIRRL